MKKLKFYKLIKILLIVLISACLCFVFGKKLDQNITKKGAAELKTAAENCARQCYAVEGVYPEDISYLEDHYGLMINHNKYIVSYECSASNRMPQIMIFEKE